MKLDNQQRRLIEIGYLCGLMDGEGTFTISKSNKRKNGKHNLHPYFQMSMRDLPTIDRAAGIIRELGIGCYVYHKGKGATHVLHCGGYKRLSQLLPIVIPYLVEKKERADLVLSYVQRRKDLPRNTPYSVHDYQDQRRMAELNVKPKHRLERSEAICSAPNVLG